jgi:hypothetical protein
VVYFNRTCLHLQVSNRSLIIFSFACLIVSEFVYLKILYANLAFQHLGFFLLAMAISSHLLERIEQRTAVAAGMVFVVLLILAGFGVKHPLLSLVMIVSVCLFLNWFVCLCKTETVWYRMVVDWLASLGAASMAIYVMHTIFSAGLREFLLSLSIDAPLPHLILGTIVGLVAPMIVLAVVKRWGLTRAMGI